MPIVGGLDIHRKQIAFDYLDTVTGEVQRGWVAPADRGHLRAWLERFAGRDGVAFALEAYLTGNATIRPLLERAGTPAVGMARSLLSRNASRTASSVLGSGSCSTQSIRRRPECGLTASTTASEHSSSSGPAGDCGWPRCWRERKSTGQLYQWPSGQRILTLSRGPLDDSAVYLSSTSAGSPHLTAPWLSVYFGQSRNITLLAIAAPRSTMTSGLRPCLEHDVEGRLADPAETRDARGSNDVADPGLTSLGAERESDFLRQ
jgi:hypothetical protein